MIDVATLTGACMVALGSNYSGLFGNNKKFIDKIVKLSEDSYEKNWPMPIDRDFHDEMKGEVADLKNIGNGREGGACTAAAFLEEFVSENVSWAHLDIAGPSMVSKKISHICLKAEVELG
jgi:leucyl aminopeptidase